MSAILEDHDLRIQELERRIDALMLALGLKLADIFPKAEEGK